jgi:hypothetical protein
LTFLIRPGCFQKHDGKVLRRPYSRWH